MSYSKSILSKDLKERKRSLVKSYNSYFRGSITKELHNTHKYNLKRIIVDLIHSIKKIENDSKK